MCRDWCFSRSQILLTTCVYQHWILEGAVFITSLFQHMLLSVCSPGEVPDTREALLNAFKRLDNDLSLEAQVRMTLKRLRASSFELV